MIYLISVCLRPPVLRYWPYSHGHMLGKSQVPILQLYNNYYIPMPAVLTLIKIAMDVASNAVDRGL